MDSHERPGWEGPSPDVLGGVVPVEQILFRDDTLVVALTSATAYPDGVILQLEWAVRGPSRPRSWNPGFRRPPDQDDDPRFSVRYADGRAATTHDPEITLHRPAGPHLEAVGGSSSSSDHSATGEWRLWLWPLPPPEPMEFGIEWPLYDVPPNSISLGGAEIVEAARRAQPYWERG